MTDIETSKTIIEMVFYVVTAIAVIAGLNDWRKEIRGRSRYETAKNAIVGAYRVRDAINNCQAPMITPGEWVDRERPKGESDAESRTLDNLFAYHNRFNRVVEAVSGWYPAVVEAEALFGEKARLLLNDLQQSASKLRAAIEIYHQSEFRGRSNTDTRRFFNIVSGIHPGMAGEEGADANFYDDGGFRQELDQQVEAIQQFFAPYIE